MSTGIASWKSCTTRELSVTHANSYALVIGFPEGGGPRAESPVFGEAKHPTGFEDALQNFSLVL